MFHDAKFPDSIVGDNAGKGRSVYSGRDDSARDEANNAARCVNKRTPIFVSILPVTKDKSVPQEYFSPDVDNFRSEKKETKQLILNAVTLDSTHIKIFTIFH